jgi:hypothetical protein
VPTWCIDGETSSDILTKIRVKSKEIVSELGEYGRRRRVIATETRSVRFTIAIAASGKLSSFALSQCNPFHVSLRNGLLQC